MQPDPRRLVRLRRLEVVRAMAKMAAAREAATAEAALSQMQALAQRSQGLVAAYAARSDADDGAAMRQLIAFRAGLAGIVRSASADAGRARALADSKLALLAEAERRRQAVEDRARSEAAAIAQPEQAPPLGARRTLGTAFE